MSIPLQGLDKLPKPIIDVILGLLRNPVTQKMGLELLRKVVNDEITDLEDHPEKIEPILQWLEHLLTGQ